MTPRQAAEIIGCSTQQVRTLIRTGKLKAIKHLTPNGPAPGFYYIISRKEAERYRDAPQKQGWPRGQRYKVVTRVNRRNTKKKRPKLDPSIRKQSKSVAEKRVIKTEISPAQRFEVLVRDDHKCRSCGKDASQTVLEVDHITPRSLGGTNALSNLQVLCQECNQGKGTRTFD